MQRIFIDMESIFSTHSFTSNQHSKCAALLNLDNKIVSSKIQLIFQGDQNGTTCIVITLSLQ